MDNLYGALTVGDVHRDFMAGVQKADGDENRKRNCSRSPESADVSAYFSQEEQSNQRIALLQYQLDFKLKRLKSIKTAARDVLDKYSLKRPHNPTFEEAQDAKRMCPFPLLPHSYESKPPLTIQQEEALWPVLNTLVKREDIQKHDPEQLAIFATRVKDNLQLKNIELTGTPEEFNEPCCSNAADIEVTRSIPHILLQGYGKSQKIKMNDYPVHLHPMIKTAMKAYLEHLAERNIGAALQVIQDAQKATVSQSIKRTRRA